MSTFNENSNCYLKVKIFYAYNRVDLVDDKYVILFYRKVNYGKISEKFNSWSGLLALRDKKFFIYYSKPYIFIYIEKSIIKFIYIIIAKKIFINLTKF